MPINDYQKVALRLLVDILRNVQKGQYEHGSVVAINKAERMMSMKKKRKGKKGY